MKGRDGKGPPAADLLVCFPPRAHLSLMPKPICSPARPSDQPAKHHHQRRHRHLRKSSNRAGAGHGHNSPLLWARSQAHNSDVSEPTSPKVTCAGQIKVRSKPSSCKNWQSVMEEIERLHNNSKQKRRSAWTEAFGFKRDVAQFLTCLRNIRFNFRCFGDFPTGGITSDDEEDGDVDDDEEDGDVDDDDEDEEENFQKSGSKEEGQENDHRSRDAFSEWLMVLQESQHEGKEFGIKEESEGKKIRPCLADEDEDDGGDAPSWPPPNALLLMRCRSAPAKSLLEEKEEEEKQSLMTRRCGADFSKISAEIGKKTWSEGGNQDMLSRSRSWKR